jgi:hypothetical protein
MQLRYRAALLAVLAVSLAACDDDLTGIDAPSPITITEPPFTGTLTVNGAVTQPFTATGFGPVTLTLVSLDPNPDNATRVSLVLGTWNGAVCQVVLANDSATAGTTVIGSVSSAGNLCARVSDAGRLTQAVNFDVTITHP